PARSRCAMLPPIGMSGAPSRWKGPNTVDSVAPSGFWWSSRSTTIETPSVSENRMNSWRLSLHILPASVRISIAWNHSASVSFTSLTKACRWLIRLSMISRSRGSCVPENRANTSAVRSSSVLLRRAPFCPSGIIDPPHRSLRGGLCRHLRLKAPLHLAPHPHRFAVCRGNIRPAHRLACCDIAHQLDAMRQPDRHRAFREAARRRHELAPDRVAAFAVEALAGLQCALRDRDDIAVEAAALTGRLAAQRC